MDELALLPESFDRLRSAVPGGFSLSERVVIRSSFWIVKPVGSPHGWQTGVWCAGRK